MKNQDSWWNHGGSGVGKSTLLNVLNGNLKPMIERYYNGYNLYDEMIRKNSRVL